MALPHTIYLTGSKVESLANKDDHIQISQTNLFLKHHS